MSRDLALAYDAMQGPDRRRCGLHARAPVEPVSAAAGAGHRRPAHRDRRRLFPEERFPGGARGGRARRQGARRHARRSKFPKPRAPAPRPMSSPPPKARRCISTGCASAPNDFDPAVRDRLIAGAMVPAPLVDRAQKFRRWYRAQVLELFKIGRRHHRAGDALHRAEARAADLHARRRRTAGARQYRHLHPADLLHRPAGGRGAGSAASRCRSACRSSPRPGARISRCALRMRWSAWASPPRRAPRGILRWKSICPTCSPR